MSRTHDWQAIRNNYPLSTVAAKSLKLTRAGREYRACCPFHSEKSPSFYINDDKQFYHCFGCHAHGDVVDFVAQIDGVDTVEAIAILTGGQAPRLSEEDREERQKWLKAQEDRRTIDQERATLSARQRWDRAHPLDGPNGYLERKGGIPPHGARVEGGKLLLPVYDADGDIMSVQTIADDGGKLFHPGAPVSGGRFNIGIKMGRTIVCEGFATGASLYEAMVDQVCVTFSKGNMHKVARDLAERGCDIVLASDADAADERRALGDALDCPVVIPSSGDDFNDEHSDRGIDSVRATFAQGLIDYRNRPEPPPPPPYCDIEFVEAFGFVEADIPLRPWLVPGALMAGNTHILAAPGGTGKSLFTLQFAVMLAQGEPWGRWKPKRKCRVLVINAEDDVDEQRRRLSAARSVMGVDAAASLPGLMLAKNPQSVLTAAMDEKSKRPVATPLVGQLVDVIRHYQIDAIIVDPFAETFEGDENSNNDAKWAMKIWRDDIARATGCAVYLVHHTTKNAGDKAGSADAIRGAGALVNSARIASTLFVMTVDEAAALNVKPEDRFRYVRYDDAEANQTLMGSRAGFEKASIIIGNGGKSEAGHNLDGDEVGALVPWEPNGLGDISDETLQGIVRAVADRYVDEDGTCTDQPFLPTKKNDSKRWIGYLIMELAGVEEAAARTIFRATMDKGLLMAAEYHDEDKNRTATGVFPARIEGL